MRNLYVSELVSQKIQPRHRHSQPLAHVCSTQLNCLMALLVDGPSTRAQYTNN